MPAHVILACVLSLSPEAPALSPFSFITSFCSRQCTDPVAGMKLACLAPFCFDILSRLLRDLRNPQRDSLSSLIAHLLLSMSRMGFISGQHTVKQLVNLLDKNNLAIFAGSFCLVELNSRNSEEQDLQAEAPGAISCGLRLSSRLDSLSDPQGTLSIP